MIRRALSRAVMRVTVSGIENSIFWDLRPTIDQIALSAAAHDSCEHQVPVIGQQRGDELSGRPDHHQRLVSGTRWAIRSGGMRRSRRVDQPGVGPYRT